MPGAPMRPQACNYPSPDIFENVSPEAPAQLTQRAHIKGRQADKLRTSPNMRVSQI